MLAYHNWVKGEHTTYIAGHFHGRKLSRYLGYLQKFSPQNLGMWCPLARHKPATCESFLHENHSFHQFAKVFSLKSFSLYGNLPMHLVCCASNLICYPNLLIASWNCPRNQLTYSVPRQLSKQVGVKAYLVPTNQLTGKFWSVSVSAFMYTCFDCIPALTEGSRLQTGARTI